MLYQCEECKALEVLWNSRDEVTPFIISCRYCKGAARHVHWHLDVYAPGFKPHKGMRIFIDLTKEKLKEYMTAQIDRFWENTEYPMSEQYASKKEALQALMSDGVKPGEPDVKEVKSNDT